jgi:hypothetical protein
MSLTCTTTLPVGRAMRYQSSSEGDDCAGVQKITRLLQN